MIEIERTCLICHKSYTLKVDAEDLDAFNEGHSVQHCFPYLSADERGLLISGMCGKCFDELCGEDYEDADEAPF